MTDSKIIKRERQRAGDITESHEEQEIKNERERERERRSDTEQDTKRQVTER